MTDDISLSLAVGLVAGVLAFACLRKSRGSRTWGQPTDPIKAAPPLTYGGVVQKAAPKAAVAILPCRLRWASWCEVVDRKTHESVAYCKENDALVAETIADLWREPDQAGSYHFDEEDDGA